MLLLGQYAATLGVSGQHDLGLETIDAMLARCERSQERWYEPDNGMHVWRAYLRDYQMMAGCRVPTDTEVTWLLDDGEYSYARFKLTAVEPNPDPAATVAHLRQ